MKRAIKFRQWCGKRFEYWGVGIDENTFVGPCSGGGLRADQTPQEQFTGLLDMNEKEIYEGDVIRMSIDPSEFNTRVHGVKKRQLETAVIKWSADDLCFYPEFRPWLKWHPCFEHMRLADADAEVIGNIHENPELLEAK